MSKESHTFFDYPRIASDLVSIRSSTLGDGPSMDVDDRTLVIRLLRHIMCNELAFRDYLSALTSELDRKNIRMHLLLEPEIELSDDEITIEGFNSLSDVQIAAIATSPESLIGIKDFLHDPDTVWGPWLFNAYIDSQKVIDETEEPAHRRMEPI